jgi:FixJ family two-component response regulator
VIGVFGTGVSKRLKASWNSQQVIFDMQQSPVIHVVDDDSSFRLAIARLLRAAKYEVRTYANAGDFLLRPSDDSTGCILLDLQMPGPNGLALQEALAAYPAQLPIIFLSGHGDVPSSVRAMKAGAIDFLTKPVQRETLLSSIQTALTLDTQKRASRERLRIWRERYRSLTAREREIFQRVVSGKLNKEIAADLGAAERTIKAHRAQMMEKMAAASIAELVQIADALRVAESQRPQAI